MRFAGHVLTFLAHRPGPAGVIAGVFILTAVLRASLFPAMGGDDGEQLIFSQFFDWGYQVRNPPLYTWMTGLLSQVLGPTLWTMTILKCGLLTAFYLLLWDAAKRLLKTREMAALAALAPALLYFMAWEVITGFSHTVLAVVAYAATFAVVVRMMEAERPGVSLHLSLGVAIAVGFQAKYAYAIFLTALLAAALTDRDLRSKLLSPMTLVTVIAAGVLILPHGLWILERVSALEAEGRGGADAADIGRSLKNVLNAAKAAFGYLSPLAVLLVLLAPRLLKSRPADGLPARTHQLAGLQALFILILTTVLALAYPDFKVRTHYMALLSLTPLWLMQRVEASGPSPERVGVLACLVGGALLVPPAGTALKAFFEPLICERCQRHIDYAGFAEDLRGAGFKGGAVNGWWHPAPLAGNLRAQFPDARVISLKHHEIVPPMNDADAGQCLIVWMIEPARDRKADSVKATNQALGTAIPTAIPHRTLTRPLVFGRGRTHTIGYILLPGTGNCR